MHEMEIVTDQQPVALSTTDDVTHDFIPRLIDPIVIRGTGHVTVFALNNKFDDEFPHALVHKVSRDEYADTIRRVNTILKKNVPNHFKWLLCGCLCCCCTIGLSFSPVICLNKRSKNAVATVLDSENVRLYHRLGLHWRLARQKCSNAKTIEDLLLSAPSLSFSPLMITAAAMRQAIVKSVISGDTFVIRPMIQTSVLGNEQQLTLNHIKAPRLARPPSNLQPNRTSTDEPYAFEAREYLRRKLVGQHICYTIDVQASETERAKCTVYLGRDKNTGENIIESLVSEGLVEVSQHTDVRASSVLYQRLRTLDQQAKVDKRGQYSDDHPGTHRRAMNWTLKDPKRFLEHHRTLPPLDAIVEFVRDGNTVRCLLLPSYYLVTIQLAGIRCPMFNREINAAHESFATEAKAFVESRLLQRDVKFIVSGTNKQNLVGTLLLSDGGDTAIGLIKDGLARCVDWSLTLLSPIRREEYRAAEQTARDQRLRIWQDYRPSSDLPVSSTSEGSPLDEYQAKVFEVVNGDALIVREFDDQPTKKIYLSSVRAPRAADFQQHAQKNTSKPKHRRPLYEVPFLFEAREFLRQHLIGKTVRVVNDYIQPACGDYTERVCCTVYVGDTNIGEALIARGLAKAVRHRQDDPHRSSRYDDLLVAEHRAEQQALGLFSSRIFLRSVVDLTREENKVRARSSLRGLQHSGRMKAIVEYVVSGSRFRVHLLKPDWVISLLLSAIDCPHGKRQLVSTDIPRTEEEDRHELMAAEALAFSNENFLQRNMYVEVDGLDSVGNFLGRLITTEEQSAAVMLVQAGLAHLHSSAHYASDYEALLAAEAQSKSKRVSVSSKTDESVVDNGDDGDQKTTIDIVDSDEKAIDFNDSGFRSALISYLSPTLTVYIQYSEQAHELEQLQAELRETFEQTEPMDEYTPDEGELLAARFSADDQWYRAKVEQIEDDYGVSVYFVDYGYRETITDFKRLAALPYVLSRMPAKAVECELAYMQPLPDDDARRTAQDAMSDALGNEECLIKTEYCQNGTDYVTLYRAGIKEHLVEAFAEQGLISMAQGQSNAQTPSTLADDATVNRYGV